MVERRSYKKVKAFCSASMATAISNAAILLILSAPIFCATPGVQAQQERLVFKKDITIDDLPPAVEKRLPPGASVSELKTMLGGQPTIVLDGATLTITAPRSGSSRSIAVKTFELRNGARIVTNGINLELDANSIASERGQIVSFADLERHVANKPEPGLSGRSGLNAGTVVINGALNTTDILNVFLPGQDGQGGGDGVKGTDGAAGPRGENGVDHLFDCAHGGGNGGAGAQGGTGGTGGDGGAGGNGGLLILRGDVAQQRVQIEFSARGGKGGVAGSPGEGGTGGPGGQGGSGSVHCSGGMQGPSGKNGFPGTPGHAGTDGQDGSISAD
jgi:hypothetical protein